jgi:hypothetical protein
MEFPEILDFFKKRLGGGKISWGEKGVCFRPFRKNKKRSN